MGCFSPNWHWVQEELAPTVRSVAYDRAGLGWSWPLAGNGMPRQLRWSYIHINWFAAWIGFRVEPYPFGLLTMIVSLEAIFLSTFAMISQNRAEEKRQVLADRQWQTVQQEEQQNEQLLHISFTQ
jgi:hypothetical protein